MLTDRIIDTIIILTIIAILAAIPVKWFRDWLWND